jgi:hypothetical protein
MWLTGNRQLRLAEDGRFKFGEDKGKRTEDKKLI